ncbi:tyrosine-type recombinase/integrase [Paenibacillus alvei]|uniref:tyrosine-type recombinase/integrase n=1 Tax=Paenibacillus alvei TaxID=44250 RepID=UPI00028946BB|nr:tyrosine-type recombinase/integrase [Paenibacillus alvei]EJW14362.1 TnP I resolvase [Paenibacillus alvei DSM 29]MCY9539402.1 tyrosine-type recombinase/integrase [Paenibacillus alvei]MEC0079820.1 tyrosine-type recombinase/integrase [Paenibacillus alvei]
MSRIDAFSAYLKAKGKSQNTIKGYVLNINQYFKWFEESFGQECVALYRQNVLDYMSYLKNIKLNNAKTINHKLSSLRSYNDFLISSGIQNDVVIQKTDMIKVQTEYTSPTQVTELEVKQFVQKVLESKNKRNYAIVTLLAYTGMRISEALSIWLSDFNLQTGECIIRNGKGEKQRTVLMNTKIINALRDYLKDRIRYSVAENSKFLFVSKKNDNLNRTVVNRIFQQYSPKITPHQLRHFFCTNAIEKGLSIHEVANQAGHSNINTTLLYTNPDKAKLKRKMELL